MVLGSSPGRATLTVVTASLSWHPALGLVRSHVYERGQNQIDIEVEETLFDRRVTATMSRALGVLEEMAGTDRVPTPSEITDSIGEGVSYELCQALSKVVNSEAVDSLDITFNWSRVAAAPAGTPLEVEFNREAVAIVERVSDQLKTSVYSREHVIYGRAAPRTGLPSRSRLARRCRLPVRRGFRLGTARTPGRR